MRNPTDPAAPLRGAFVGSASGSVSIAAHALGGGAVSLGTPSTALLIAACAAIGVLVAARPNRHGLGEVMAMLAIGQTVAHGASSFFADHQHHGGSPAVMLAAHLGAIPLGALLIRAAEHALLRAATELRRTVRLLTDGIAAPGHLAPATFGGPFRAPRRLLDASGSGLRGPPSWH